ncbi:Putative lipoate-protein ligase A [Verticillium dahliae VDG2]|nr:Putative lipoate-protein ligase A [Verticillium dahliae VDG2]
MPRMKTTSNQSPSTPAFPFDLFDDEESEAESLQTPRPKTEKHYSQQILHIVNDDDDDMSVVEDNDIDHMVQRPKRQLNQSVSGASSAKRRKLDKSGARQRQQPTITSHFGSGNGASAKRQKPPRRSQNKEKSSMRASKKKPQRTYNPPRLGILDVIEPEAPRFLRLAARTVKSKAQRGRSSPSRKTICLGTREDQLDAGRVLQDWIGGEIRPRHSVTNSSTAVQGSDRQPLAHISHNGVAPGSSESPDTSTDSFSRITQPNRNAAAKNTSRMLPRSRAASARPAQFEADVMNEASTVSFQTKKRMLDAIYRRGARPRSVFQSTMSLMAKDNDGSLVMEETESAVRKDLSVNVTKPSRRRSKKTEKPTRVDTRAPQYRHAHDPLPSGPRTDGHISAADLGVDQLLGLAPFGAHYSEHFEVFPLQRGVFFHEETLLGSGCFQASLASGLLEKIKQPRPRIYFNLSGQPLKWGLWDEQTSSEFGVLVDAICNHLTEKGPDGDSGFDTRDAARFMRTYVQDSLSVTDDTNLGTFLSRLQLVFEGFFSRFKGQATFLDRRKTIKALEVLSEFLIIVLCSLSICRDQASMIPQIMGLETLLREVIATSVACLLQIGTTSLVTLYGSLQQLTNRERGIRADNVAAQTWVMLMRALGHLRIPRMSFWDVTFPVLIKGEDKTGLNVQRFEQLWETMFTLLPLCEFDSSGVLVSDTRHSVAMDGWALPQLALKRVFQLYKANNRQPPGFNDYCRTLVRRCVYLVDNWGWYRCGGVIGTVFDFFGSQNLSNLRNEEVFQSPAFLEHLHVETALRVEPEDRCFHIFLKLVALTIQRLVQTGSDREIRNLVARTLPNHDRQYLKEQNVHQHDLAALRNHHDLLCTLFWATPAELRPSTLLALLEKLVVPSSSHKEACLINLKAWAQLARFVVHKESVAAFRPFSLWQGSAFQQLLDQYDSTASDIQQQLSSMSKDASHGIDQNLINGIIASNKSATMEVIRYSVAISLDVAKCARSLELSIFAGNLVQLRHVLRQFSKSPAEYPLSILKDAVATVDVFLVHVERALGSVQKENNAAGLEDGIMKIDNDLTADFYAMARNMLQTSSTVDCSPQTITKMEEAREQVVTVAGRLAAILIRCGTIRLSRCFKTSQRSKAGKHELFEGLPNQLVPLQSRYLHLFLANLDKELDLTDVGVSVLQLWLLSLTKPREDMLFEHQFALSLKKLKYPFLPAESDMLRHANYDMNCDMLRKTLVWMRTSLRTSSTPLQKKSNTSDYAAALKAVMQRIQNDLHDVSLTNDAQHTRYVQFVRRVVSLVKSHTTEIFQIPPFFYQVSKEYSPPVQDPHLQVDSIKSYGLRLNEGDSPAMPQLFYYMYNNFKQALLHGRLGHETRILAKGMKDDAILGFTLGTMLPVVLSASVMKPEAFVLFDTYCEAIRLRLDGVAARQMDQSREQIPTLIRAMMRWIRGVRCLNDGVLCVEHLHLFRKMVVLLAMLQPTLAAASYDASAPAAAAWSVMQQALSCWSEATENAASHLASSLADPYEDDVSAGLFQDVIVEDGFVGEDETLVASLARGTVTDFERNWLVTAELIVAQAPARATQAGQGLARPHWDMEELGQCLLRELQTWNAWWARCRAHMQDELIGEAEEMMFL